MPARSAAALCFAHEAIALRSGGNLLRQQRVELRFVGRSLCRLARDDRGDGADVSGEQLTGALCDLGRQRAHWNEIGSQHRVRGARHRGGGRIRPAALAKTQKLTSFLGAFQVAGQQLIQLLAARRGGRGIAHQNSRHRTDQREELPLDLGELLARPGDERTGLAVSLRPRRARYLGRFLRLTVRLTCTERTGAGHRLERAACGHWRRWYRAPYSGRLTVNGGGDQPGALRQGRRWWFRRYHLPTRAQRLLKLDRRGIAVGRSFFQRLRDDRVEGLRDRGIDR